MHVGPARTASILWENCVNNLYVGKTRIAYADSGNAAMSGLVHRAAETGQTAYGQTRSFAEIPECRKRSE
jgi:hypothetical protein